MREIGLIGPQMATVLRVFLTDVDRAWYGFELMQETSIASGSIYPLLQRLVEAGWLMREPEDVNPKEAGRPTRYYYRLVGGAAGVVRARLAEMAELYAPPLQQQQPLPHSRDTLLAQITVCSS